MSTANTEIPCTKFYNKPRKMSNSQTQLIWTLWLELNTKEIKEDMSIVKINIANLHKAVILRNQSMDTLKNHSSMYY